MKTAIKNTYLVTVLSLLSIAAFADNKTPATNSVVGNFQCQRTDSANVKTDYDLSVSKSGDTFVFQWDDKTGNPAFYGTGVMHPSQPNMVASSFWDPAKPEKLGIEMIEIKPDGSLQSNWVLQSENTLGASTCTKSK